MGLPCSRRVPRARRYSRATSLHHYGTVTLYGQPFQVAHGAMSLSAFARRYLRNRGCFLFLWLLRCFSSPGSPRHPMHSGADDPEGPGFPIQKSSDQSLFASSPRHIAGYNVFRRLLTPSHPPHALSSLITPTCNRSARPDALATGRASQTFAGTPIGTIYTDDPTQVLQLPGASTSHTLFEFSVDIQRDRPPGETDARRIQH